MSVQAEVLVPGQGAAPVGSPAAHPSGQLAVADWRFLLPRLRYRRILHVGVPDPAAWPVLAEMAPLTVVATASVPALRRAATAALPGRESVQLVAAAAGARLPFPAGTFDLVLGLAGGRDSELLLRPAQWLGELDRLLAVDGVALVETERLGQAARLERSLGAAEAHGFIPPELHWTARRKRMLRLSMPLARQQTRLRCLDEVVSGVSRRGRALLRAARALGRLGGLDYLVPRRLLLLQRRGSPAGHAGIGGYILDRFAAAGVRLADPNVAFYARANGIANKVTFLVFDRDALAFVTKLTRTPSFNERLEAEHQALVALHQSGAAPAGSYPRSLFLDYHEGLAVVGQTAVHGTAFRNSSDASRQCPAARRALEWITALGEASAARPPADVDAEPPLADLERRFHQLFQLPESEREFLDRQFAELARLAPELPTVFQHGDAGTWNAVVEDGAGRIAFLDWEDGRAAGVPLWDLFFFVQDYGSWAGRLRGVRDGATAAATALTTRTQYHRMLVEATRRYCARVGITAELVEPLFYTCWVERAVRLAPKARGPLEHIKFYRLLRALIAQRQRPELSCLFE